METLGSATVVCSVSVAGLGCTGRTRPSSDGGPALVGRTIRQINSVLDIAEAGTQAWRNLLQGKGLL